MLEYNIVDISDGTDVSKTSPTKECDIVTIGILEILVLSTNHNFAMAVTI